MGADTQPGSPGIARLIDARIDGDRSNVCVHAALIDLSAEPAVQRASGCAAQRSDIPRGPARFELGSISKVFVGLLSAQMVASGELKLDEPFSNLLPKGTTAPQSEGRLITLRDLLTHTSGLPPLPPKLGWNVDPANPYARLSADIVYAGLANLKVATPGTRYAYSNWAFLMLSDGLARRAGQTYDVLLTERVLKPLRMRDTVVSGSDGLLPGRMANGTSTVHWDVPVEFAGAVGLRSTLDDMIKLARALLGEVPADAPASLRTALKISMQPQHVVNDSIEVGLAWHLSKRPGRSPFVFQNGVTGGFSSMLLLDPANRRAAITLADSAGRFDDLAFKLLDPSTPLEAPRRRVPLDVSQALAAVGQYELHPGVSLSLSVQNSKLYAQASGQDRFELQQDSRGDYYALVADILIRIHRDGSGSASGLTLFQRGAAIQGKRLAN